MSVSDTALTIPEDLKPADGRFGCGPSKVRPAQLARLAEGDAAALMGTSHRQKPVKSLVGQVRSGLKDLFQVPEGYEVMLGNGGTTAFWDAATFGLVKEKALHLTYGEFSSKFAKSTNAAPFLQDSIIVKADAGDAPAPDLRSVRRRDRVGAQRDLHRRDGPGRARRRRARADRRDLRRGRPARRRQGRRRLLLRAAEVLRRRRWPVAGARRAPRRRSGSPRSHGSGRWIPEFLSLNTALDNSLKDQTYNTPAIATLVLLADQLEWMLGLGGLKGCVERTTASSTHLYDWAEATGYTTPFVKDPAKRSLVVGTIDFDDAVDAAAVAKVLRANGIVDTEPYRKLGRNQLRVAMFPAIDTADIEALTACIDYVVEKL